jgi:TolA-binding protein
VSGLQQQLQRMAAGQAQAALEQRLEIQQSQLADRGQEVVALRQALQQQSQQHEQQQEELRRLRAALQQQSQQLLQRRAPYRPPAVASAPGSVASSRVASARAQLEEPRVGAGGVRLPALAQKAVPPPAGSSAQPQGGLAFHEDLSKLRR